MASYIQQRKSILQSRLSRIQATLSKLYDLSSEQSLTAVESYGFDSGEGSQRTTRRKLAEINDQIERLEAEQDHYINELNNMGIMSIQLRRKNNSTRNVMF
jgi:conjugal transfer/entry exclusion protein